MPASATDPPDLDAAPVNLKTTLRNLPLAPAGGGGSGDTLRDALRAIDARLAEAAVIVDPASAVPLGIVTLRDAVRASSTRTATWPGRSPCIMTGGLASLSADATVHQATVLMFRRGMRHLILDRRPMAACSTSSRRAICTACRRRIRPAWPNAILAARSIDELAAQTTAVRRFAARRLAEGSGPRRFANGSPRSTT
jgi:CBS domain-containing protein